MNTKLGLALLCICLSTWSRQAPAQSRSPNIIFILVDDQGYGDIGVFYQNQRAKEGKPYERSPYLDQMASEGAIFTQQYAAAPVCAPSRASIMLGVSQGHANVRDNQFDKALADNYTMPYTLKQLGYSTVAIGKWGLQGDKRWDKNGADWPARPLNRGFDYFFGYMRHGDGHEHYPKEGKYRGKKQVWFNGTEVSGELDSCYTVDLWTAAAKHWITDHELGRDKNKPFFMYLAYDTPHAVDELPTQKYPEGGGLHGGIQWLGTAGHFINTASGRIDSYINPDYANAVYDGDSDPSTPEVPWPNTYQRYATANRRIDFAVGDILKLLQDLHIDSNTLVVYTSDNGPSIETYLDNEPKLAKQLPTFFGSYGPFDGIKRDDWEGGVRMPAIAWWPGHIPAGKVIAEPSISYDWAPTFIAMAGKAAPERMDGVSLLPSLTGKGMPNSGLIYIEYYQNGKTPDFTTFAPSHRGRRRNQMQNIRLGRYVGVRYNVKSADDDFEIYDVIEDPKEIKNLAIQPQKKVKIKNQIWTIGKLQAFMKARTLQVRRPDSTAARPYDSAFVPAVRKEVTPGIVWKLYGDQVPWIPQTGDLPILRQGYGVFPDIQLERQKSSHILSVEGYIRIPEDGKYTFYLKTGTKAFLRLHDIQLIDEDFVYEPGTEKQTSVFLKRGLHPFKLCYKLGENTKPSVDLKWSGPNIKKQSVSQDYFSRTEKSTFNQK